VGAKVDCALLIALDGLHEAEEGRPRQTWVREREGVNATSE